MSRRLAHVSMIAAAGIAASPEAWAGPGKPPAMEQIGVDERLGASIPAGLEFTDTEGRRVEIGEYFDGEMPVVLMLAYSDCPMLCNLVLRGAAEAVSSLSLKLGEDFRALTVSIDPDETRDEAEATQDAVLAQAGYDGAREDWPFVVGDEAEIAELADSLGFGYAYDQRNEQYAHPAVIFAISPRGEISRYLYGFEYDTRDLRLALVEASEGKTGSFADRVILSCYRYDPATRQYGLYIEGFLRAGAAAAVVALGVGIFLLRRKERRRV